MRISAGEFKGRKIGSKKALGLVTKHGVLRPTSSKVRESIFNILGGVTEGSLFVDLYAGTGAVGLEAMSRGAEKVFFVEADKKRAEQIEKTLGKCEGSSRGSIIRQEAAAFIKQAQEDSLKFDIIFLDPPYYSGELEDILSVLADAGIVRDGGIVMAEHLSKKRLPETVGSLRQKKAYKYGDTMLTLFRKEQ